MCGSAVAQLLGRALEARRLYLAQLRDRLGEAAVRQVARAGQIG